MLRNRTSNTVDSFLCGWLPPPVIMKTSSTESHCGKIEAARIANQMTNSISDSRSLKSGVFALERLLGLVVLLGLNVCFSYSLEAHFLDFHTAQPFSNVAEDGTGVFAIPLTEVFLSSTIKLPVTAIFRTKTSVASGGILGYGWSIPALESCAFQLDEKKFRFFMPDGSIIDLKRSKENPDILKGHQGWQALIEKSTIRLSNKNYGQLVFKNGKLCSLICGAKTTNLNYLDSIVELKENNNLIIALKKDSSTGDVVIKSESDNILISRGKRPVISSNGSANILNGFCLSPVAFTRNDKQLAIISYGGNPNLHPTITCEGADGIETEIAWVPSTGAVTSINAAKFKTSKVGEEVIIEKTLKDGSFEVWKNNETLRRTTTLKNGKETVIYRYAGNIPIAGVTRKIVEKSDGKESVVYSLRVNENLAPLQEINRLNGRNEIVSYEYDTQGKIKERKLTINGQEFWKELYTNGFVTEKQFQGGSIVFHP